MSAPAYLDRAQVRRHYGLTRVDVDRLFATLDQVRLPDSRKVYLRARDIEEYIERHVVSVTGRAA
ncbi:MAG: hypothetical protein H0W82_05440 [Actinobacteria bacterium]|nr:hypothetical protein [Actinomycetota bacterium]